MASVYTESSGYTEAGGSTLRHFWNDDLRRHGSVVIRLLRLFVDRRFFRLGFAAAERAREIPLCDLLRIVGQCVADSGIQAGGCLHGIRHGVLNGGCRGVAGMRSHNVLGDGLIESLDVGVQIIEEA